MLPSQKPFRETQLNRTHPLAKGLVGCWLFNEATGETVFDLSGNGNNGTLKNGVAWDSGGLRFDGVDDYVSCGSGGNFISEDFTLGARIYINSLPTSGTGDTPVLFYKGEYQVNGYYLQLDYANSQHDGGFKFHTNQPDATQRTYSDTGILTTGQWIRLVVVRNGSDVTLYKNGLDVTNTPGTHINPASSSDNFQISKYANNIASYFLNGSIDSVQIYNRALSAEEVAWSYREPYAMFEPTFNPALLYSAAPPVGAIMNQFQKANIGADLYNGAFV